MNQSKKEKIRIELIRKSLHLTIALALPIAAYHKVLCIVLLLLGTALYTTIEGLWYFRHRGNFISRIIQMASRERDEGKFVIGPVTLGLGAVLSLWLLPFVAAVPAIFALAFGDGLASLFGILIPSRKIPYTGSKSVSGSMACMAGVFFSMYLYTGKPLLSLELAAGAAVLEMLPIKDFDNIIIPLGTGALYLLIS